MLVELLKTSWYYQNTLNNHLYSHPPYLTCFLLMKMDTDILGKNLEKLGRNFKFMNKLIFLKTRGYFFILASSSSPLVSSTSCLPTWTRGFPRSAPMRNYNSGGVYFLFPWWGGWIPSSLCCRHGHLLMRRLNFPWEIKLQLLWW